MTELERKWQHLLEILKNTGGAAVAFSGGVDSTLLLYAAKAALGERVVALTALSDVIPESEADEAEEYCRENGIPQEVLHVNVFDIDGFSDNPPDRCYLCKKALFAKMKERAAAHGYSAVLEGSNRDDAKDFRPGLRAIRELGILSPLGEAELSKAEIRELSGMLHLPTSKKPSYACLASRFVYGQKITKEGLSRVEQAENFLHSLGFAQCRVRSHGDLARIEVERAALSSALASGDAITRKLKSLGFSYVCLDLSGYRTGSMNETLDEKTIKEALSGRDA